MEIVRNHVITPNEVLDYLMKHPKRISEFQEAIREASTRYGYLWEAFCSDYRARAAKLIMEDIL